MKMNLICAHYIRNGLNMCKRYVVNHVNHVNNDEKEVLNNTSLTCTLENSELLTKFFTEKSKRQVKKLEIIIRTSRNIAAFLFQKFPSGSRVAAIPLINFTILQGLIMNMFVCIHI